MVRQRCAWPQPASCGAGRHPASVVGETRRLAREVGLGPEFVNQNCDYHRMVTTTQAADPLVVDGRGQRARTSCRLKRSGSAALPERFQQWPRAAAFGAPRTRPPRSWRGCGWADSSGSRRQKRRSFETVPPRMRARRGTRIQPNRSAPLTSIVKDANNRRLLKPCLSS